MTSSSMTDQHKLKALRIRLKELGITTQDENLLEVFVSQSPIPVAITMIFIDKYELKKEKYEIDQIRNGEFYATSQELWDWAATKWSGSLDQLRRGKTPHVYADLVRGIEDSGDDLSTQGEGLSVNTSRCSNVKVLNNAIHSIFGSPNCNKGHLIPKSATCRPFYGPVAEIATGFDLRNDPDRQKKRKKLLRGGKTTDGHGFFGLEKRAENFVMVNNPHCAIFDTLEKGVLAIIPICNAEFSCEWQQGNAYDLLVVANNAETYKNLSIINSGRFNEEVHLQASPEEIKKATDFLGISIKALAEILASEDNILLNPMENFLNESLDVDHNDQTKQSHVQMRNKLKELDKLRSNFAQNGTVEVPSIKKNREDKVVLKIDMKKYMETSGVTALRSSGLYPYPDPWLVGMKAAINIYYGHKQVKLHPACPSPTHDDDSDDEDCWYIDAVYGSSPCAIGAVQHNSIQGENVSLPQDISIVSYDDDDSSMVTDDGEYCAFSTTGEQIVACKTANQKLQGRNVTP